jgi:hypothetical protein
MTNGRTYDIALRTDFKDDRALVRRIEALTAAAYVSNTTLIEREIAHNSDIYTITDESSRLLAFFMVNEEMTAGRESYYLGLSAADDELKGKGLATTLYRRFLSDCAARERETGRKYLLWWTTATPIVYYWFNTYAARVQPDMNGDYDAAGAKLAAAIRAEKYPDVAADPHPFILRRVASGAAYSPAEQARLAAAAAALGLKVFEKFDLREGDADRFLMFGYAP